MESAERYLKRFFVSIIYLFVSPLFLLLLLWCVKSITIKLGQYLILFSLYYYYLLINLLFLLCYICIFYVHIIPLIIILISLHLILFSHVLYFRHPGDQRSDYKGEDLDMMMWLETNNESESYLPDLHFTYYKSFLIIDWWLDAKGGSWQMKPRKWLIRAVMAVKPRNEQWFTVT